jgi:hypothetical protein
MSATDKKITEEQAIAWTSAYRSSPSTNARAFLIPIEDMQGIIDEISDQGGEPCARAYLAMDGTQEKLVIVGTTQDTSAPGPTVYRDMLPSINPAYSIYDFTKPCPTWCDPSSPLN